MRKFILSNVKGGLLPKSTSPGITVEVIWDPEQAISYIGLIAPPGEERMALIDEAFTHLWKGLKQSGYDLSLLAQDPQQMLYTIVFEDFVLEEDKRVFLSQWGKQILEFFEYGYEPEIKHLLLPALYYGLEQVALAFYWPEYPEYVRDYIRSWDPQWYEKYLGSIKNEENG